jgi:hypothetical protein
LQLAQLAHEILVQLLFSRLGGGVMCCRFLVSNKAKRGRSMQKPHQNRTCDAVSRALADSVPKCSSSTLEPSLLFSATSCVSRCECTAKRWNQRLFGFFGVVFCAG